MHKQLERFRLLNLGLLAVLMVGVVFFDVIFFNRTLQPSNILPHTGKPADWQASSVLLPVINPDAQASDGFADLNASAWQARLDGEVAAVRRVHEAFRGVDLPAGKHRVVFYYDMPALRYGSYAFVFALLLLAGISGWSCWSRGECNE